MSTAKELHAKIIKLTCWDKIIFRIIGDVDGRHVDELGHQMDCDNMQDAIAIVRGIATRNRWTLRAEIVDRT